MIFDEFDQYSENLLMSQYEISDIISHELTKGEVREEFLISTLGSCSEPKPNLVKGTISDGTRDAGQLDIVLCRPNSHVRRIGSHCLIEKNDSLCAIEVKGNCTGTDLNGAEKRAKRIQKLNGEHAPLFGVICYKIALSESTIMKRFGYSYDRNSDTYYDNATIRGEMRSNWGPLSYPNLDFFICLEEDKKMFLRKYEMASGKQRFTRLSTTPVIKELFILMRSLWTPLNAG